HTIFMVTSAGKSFAFLGDLTHHAVLLLEKPRMEFSYDSDPKQAAATRVKLLDMIAANKTPIMSYHFAWPGFGHIAKTADGFHYYPEAMKMELGGSAPPPGRPVWPAPEAAGYAAPASRSGTNRMLRIFT